MLSEHKFEYDGLTYRCARRMTPLPFEKDEPFGFETLPGFEKRDRPPTTYWDVVRSDGATRGVWVPVGEEVERRLEVEWLEVETLKEFGVSGS